MTQTQREQTQGEMTAVTEAGTAEIWRLSVSGQAAVGRHPLFGRGNTKALGSEPSRPTRCPTACHPLPVTRSAGRAQLFQFELGAHFLFQGLAWQYHCRWSLPSGIAPASILLNAAKPQHTSQCKDLSCATAPSGLHTLSPPLPHCPLPTVTCTMAHCGQRQGVSTDAHPSVSYSDGSPTFAFFRLFRGGAESSTRVYNGSLPRVPPSGESELVSSSVVNLLQRPGGLSRVAMSLTRGCAIWRNGDRECP